MTEIAQLQSQLADCRRHSDNHRRSRDYHKETNAALRKEIDMLNDSVKYWHAEHDLLTDDLIESKRHHSAWATISIVAICYGLAMTVLFAWAVRL
jgi:CCR4-NOT transcriptional regulation complex NOT5 subunit